MSFSAAADCEISSVMRSISDRTPRPVTASILRTPDATDDSDTILNSPKAEVFETCVPPQSSIERPGTFTTRTISPYFFTEQRHCAERLGVGYRHFAVFNIYCVKHGVVHIIFDRRQLVAAKSLKMGKVKSHAAVGHKLTCLLNVRAENLPQSCLEQVGCRVVTAYIHAPFAVYFRLCPAFLPKHHLLRPCST